MIYSFTYSSFYKYLLSTFCSPCLFRQEKFHSEQDTVPTLSYLTVLLREIDHKQVHRQMHNIMIGSNQGLLKLKQVREIESKGKIMLYFK